MRWRLLGDERDKYILTVFILIGLIIRLWGIRGDLPFNYYGDESYLIYHSLKFGTGDLNPHWFVWPTLFQYLLFFFFGIFYFLGFILGRFKNATDFLYLYFKDPSIFFLIGRITTAILGTASIYLVYLLAKKSYNKNTGLISAGIFTFLPLAVEYSHYAVVDTPLVFMILLSFIFIIKIFLYGRFRDYLLSGFFSGLAIATKYPAAFLVAPIFLSHLFAFQGKRFLKSIFNLKVMLCFIFIFLGFFAACPFALLDFPKFFADIKGLALCQKLGWFGWERANPYINHLTGNLKNGMGLSLLIFSMVGLAYAMIRRKIADLVLLSLPVVYFLFIGRGKNPYARFMLPILPFLAIFSGRLLADLEATLVKVGKKGKFFLCVLLVFLLASPIYRSINADFNFTLPNTMTLAKQWVYKHIPSKSKILLNEYGSPLVQSPYKLRLEAQAKPKELLGYGYHKKRNIFYQIKEKVAQESINFDLTYISHPIGYLEGETGYELIMRQTQEAIKDYKDKYDFIIISDVLLYKLLKYPKESIPQRYHKLRSFYEEILNNYQPIKVFEAKPNVAKGPKIMIYKLE